MVCAILGTTYTGQYEDVQTMDKLLGKKNKKEGLSVYIHVDAASGGFVAPFANPNLVWDFQLVRACDPLPIACGLLTLQVAPRLLDQREWT